MAKTGKETPELRAIAVLEWTGEQGKPKASRLVPVAVLDGGQLQDGAIYLARPQPLALAGEVEYELQQNGKPVGLFDIENTGQEQGSWVGYGSWKAMPTAKAKPTQQELARMQIDDDSQSDVPVLHRKHHADDPPSSGTGSSSGGGHSTSASDSSTPPDPDRPTLHKKSASSGDASASAPASADSSAPTDSDRPTLHKKDASSASDETGTTAASSSTPSDPDRPTLHKKASNDSSGDASTAPTTSTSAAGQDQPVLHKKAASESTGDASTTTASSSSDADPDRPTLHKKSSDDSAASGSAIPDDPDRPVLKKTKKKKQEDVGYSEGLAGVTDPDRPRLKRGATGDYKLNVIPSLMGLPPEMQQAVAVSDTKAQPEHPWNYTWSNPDDEEKMKSALEDVARDALGLKTPPPPPPPAPKRSTSRKSGKPVPPPPPPEPAPLEGEQFRVFELSYGSGATLVLSAHTAGPLAQEKFVTLVAQPDLYGNALVLLKSVTDGAHLDDTPRMRLIDAVDALADNRGELLFELRGQTQRQFALYRVLRGQAEKLFVGGGGEFGAERMGSKE